MRQTYTGQHKKRDFAAMCIWQGKKKGRQRRSREKHAFQNSLKPGSPPDCMTQMKSDLKPLQPLPPLLWIPFPQSSDDPPNLAFLRPFTSLLYRVLPYSFTVPCLLLSQSLRGGSLCTEAGTRLHTLCSQHKISKLSQICDVASP